MERGGKVKNYIYIGRKETRLFIDCGTLEVYRVPTDISVSSPIINALSAVVCAIMFAGPLVFLRTDNFILFFILTAIAFALIVAVLYGRQKVRNRNFDEYIARTPRARVNDDVHKIFGRYALKNAVRSVLITLFAAAIFAGAWYIAFVEKRTDYAILLCFYTSSFLPLILYGFRPVGTIVCYYNYRNYPERKL